MRGRVLLQGLVALVTALVLPTRAAELAAGGYHVVRVESGSVLGLGDGTYGQLGTEPAGVPATVAGLDGITDVAAGGFSTLALRDDGSVWFLGETTLPHTTPHGTPNAVSTPVPVAGLAGIDAIAAGHRHFLALDADTGELYGWGHNGSGQVGNGERLDVSTPVVVLTGVVAMAAGDGFSLAVRTDRTCWSWGRNHHGQLGLGDTADRLAPVRVPGVTTAGAVAAGGRHSLILLTGGSVLAAGHNDFGQLGLGHTEASPIPTPVPGLTGVTAVAAGRAHSAALGPAGVVSLWGRNIEGQCGAGPTVHPAPVELAGLPADAKGVACGDHFTVFSLGDGSTWGTGSNGDGQLDGISLADQDASPRVLGPRILPFEPDESPPLPDPMSFERPPEASSPTSITMTATAASDPSGVQYYFECTTPGGHDSGWQDDPAYVDQGLSPGTTQAYRVAARDRSPARNTTGFSGVAAATTPDGPLLAVEFVEDDQEGFRIWPQAFAGTSSRAEFATDPVATSGLTTVTVTTSTSFGTPTNRGSVDGSPPGYTYQHLYEDLLIATSSTGFLSLEVGGLKADTPYRFTLHAWDPGAVADDDKVWTVTSGTSTPASASLNFQDPLVDNGSFAMVFEIVTTAAGGFQLTNTDGLYQSAINGFSLEKLADPPLTFAGWIAGFGLDPGLRGFGDDPDGDGLANGIEAWFGTDPDQSTTALTGLVADGAVITFTHPRGAVVPVDVAGFYEWSPNLVDWYEGDGIAGPPGGPRVTFGVEAGGAGATVTATVRDPGARLFFRAGARLLP